MTTRELVLLSPYRFPAQHPLTLADEDMASWLNGYSALWHPLAARLAAAPPRVDSAKDHETPRSGCIYAVPVSPPSLLPEDWEETVRAAGAIAFCATPEREGTLANLKAALPEAAPNDHNTKVAAFLGVGFGYLL